MIEISFSQFYNGDFPDEGYELYIVKNARKKVMYVGISHGGVWNRWFGGSASHMQRTLEGEMLGYSEIGRAIQRQLPESWSWFIELWTSEDCIQNLLSEGISTLGDRDVRRLSILEIEGYWIRALAPPYNCLNVGHRDEPGSVHIPRLVARAPTACVTLEAAIEQYLRFVESDHSLRTRMTYSNALRLFSDVTRRASVDPTSLQVSAVTDDMLLNFGGRLNVYAASTRKLYSHAVLNFLQFIVAEGLAEVNLARAGRLLLRRPPDHLRAQPHKIPVAEIARLLEGIDDPAFGEIPDVHERLRALRDRGFLLTLADTGLRVHEACRLRRGDIDWNEGHAMVIGKGDKQALVRFSDRSLRALKDYLAARAALDGNSGKPLASLPLFARHDKGAGRKVKSITTATGRNIVHERAEQVLGRIASERITPHSLRHYFVTTVLKVSGNLRMAQELARHTSIAVTQRYTHLSNDELDRGYHEIFNKNSEGQAHNH